MLYDVSTVPIIALRTQNASAGAGLNSLFVAPGWSFAKVVPVASPTMDGAERLRQARDAEKRIKTFGDA